MQAVRMIMLSLLKSADQESFAKTKTAARWTAYEHNIAKARPFSFHIGMNIMDITVTETAQIMFRSKPLFIWPVPIMPYPTRLAILARKKAGTTRRTTVAAPK